MWPRTIREDGLDVDAGIVPWQVALEFRHPQPEILAQHLTSGRVDPHLVVVRRQAEAGAHAGALERHRDEQQGRAVNGLPLLARQARKPMAR